MTYQHKQLSSCRWFELTFFEQMANIGSEVERTILWREKKKEYSIKAMERALELLDLTVSDIKNKAGSKLRELMRLREVLVDYFYFDNQYSSSDKLWRNYFYAFNYAARLKK
jgi:hypothetical protein